MLLHLLHDYILNDTLTEKQAETKAFEIVSVKLNATVKAITVHLKNINATDQ